MGGVNGWQQFHVCLVWLEGARGVGGGGRGDTVAGGKRVIYIYMGSLCAGVSHVSFLSIGCW